MTQQFMPSYALRANEPPPSQRMAKLAFVLAVLVCLPLAWPVSIVLSVIVIVRSLIGPNRGIGLAVGALLVDAAWLAIAVIAVVYGVVPSSLTGGTTTAELEVGDCFDVDGGAQRDSVATVTTTACTESHTYEVFHREQLAADAAWPGEARLQRQAKAVCAPPFKQAFGTSRASGSVSVTTFLPDRDAWQDGDRFVLCVVSAPGGSTSTSLLPRG